MSFEFHGSPQQKFQQQYINTQTFVVPFMQEGGIALNIHTKVLEIGCGEGGVLKAFTDLGCKCVGVDLADNRVQDAKSLMSEEVANGLVAFITQNVYDEDFLSKYQNSFDLIILKDTIEHIPNQEQFIPYLKRFLRENGHIFFGFPPWCMPFGGHQQVAKNKLASKLPYYHLLPYPLFKAFLRACGESDVTMQALLEVKDTGISTWRFEQILAKSELSITKRVFYLLNPIYRYKFGWDFAPIKQLKPIYYLPGLRDFVTMCAYYLVKK